MSVLHLVLVYPGSRVAGFRPSVVEGRPCRRAALAGGVVLFLGAGAGFSGGMVRRPSD